jgi:hypothetical protein
VKQHVGVVRRSLRLGLCIIYVFSFTALAAANDIPAGQQGDDAVNPLIQRMIGDWDVRQRMWPGAQAKALDLPPAVAHRVLIGPVILQETMALKSGSSEAPFTRLAYFDFNIVTHRFEYFSLDTRAPQMMSERSLTAGAGSNSHLSAPLTLYGGRFIAPQWGESKNVPFRYRIAIGDVDKEQQTVRLYFTPQSAADAREFLAFEYVYTRKR